jgi:hypothetical protein
MGYFLHAEYETQMQWEVKMESSLFNGAMSIGGLQVELSGGLSPHSFLRS